MELCVQSCEQYNIPWIAYQWRKPPITTLDMLINDNMLLNPRLNHPDNLVHLKEAMCSTGHISLWRIIAERHTGAVAIFEHDAIVKRNFRSVDVEDREIAFLGYRLDSTDDYQCTDDPFTKYPIKQFSGTHGYAITPNTAKHLLDTITKKDQFSRLCENCQCDKEYLPICSVDWWLGHNMLGLDKLSIVDPCPMIAVVGGRKSYTQRNDVVAKFNVPSEDGWPTGFISGIVNKNKYFLDGRNYLTFR
jgi:GR25 family glycosyltransferase involved in LPS biosynthesis